MNPRTLAFAAVLAAALAVAAAVVRKLPPETVVENETVSFESLGAGAVRSANTSVFSAALRESGEAVVSGVRLGEARLDYVRDGQVFASRSVTVVPVFWQVLKKMFTDDPEITVDIVGDKVVVGGYTANVDTLRRVESAKALDPARIVAQVGYSTAQIAELVRDFLARAGSTNVSVSVVGREVCLAGRMYDTQSIAQLKARVEGFVKDFPGMTVNTDELRVYKQKILINIEFVAYNDKISRNLGFSGPESISAGFDFTFGYDYNNGWKNNRTHKNDGEGKFSDSRTSTTTSDGQTTTTKDETTRNPSLSQTLNKTVERGHEITHALKGGASAKIEGVKATINLLKRNGAAKTVYATTLSTQSGIEAEFQNGGTIHRSTMAGVGASGGLESIEYGYIIKTTPLIVDANTVNLDFSLDNKQPLSRDAADIEISRYQTKSKYLVRPGESIMLSGYKYNDESETKKGTPWLSNIPWIGEYLFGNRENTVNMNEMLLVVTVDWAVEGESEAAAARLGELKGRKVEVEMP